MNKKFTVIQVGLGPMGKLITKLLLKRKNIHLKVMFVVYRVKLLPKSMARK